MANSDNSFASRASSDGLGARGGDVLERNKVLMIQNEVRGMLGGVSRGGGWIAGFKAFTVQTVWAQTRRVADAIMFSILEL